MDLSLSGLASGFDWKSVVAQITEVERAPENRLLLEQNKLEERNNSYGSLVTQLQVLQNRADALKDPSLYGSHAAGVADATKLKASASTAAALGSYTFKIEHLASASSLQSSVRASSPLSPTDDVSQLVVGTAGFSSAISAGTFTVNGKRVTFAATDTLQGVFDKIRDATGGTVTASYSAATDKITLASAAPIVLGSATDTSSFLQASRLYNNGTGAVSSTSILAGLKPTTKLEAAALATPLLATTEEPGQFRINGVTIEYNTHDDTVGDVLSRINQSDAGVLASYDATHDRFVLTNKSSGDVGFALEDVSGNFLAATNLAGGTLNRGNNLVYTVNGGDPLASATNTITEASSGIAGLTITALQEGTTTVEVSTDTSKIKTAITDFLADYNKLQAMIDADTASSTDAKGKVTAGVLANDTQADRLASDLRSMVNAVVSGLSGTIRQLDSLGIQSNGTDNQISLSDESKLDAALAAHAGEVEDFFSNSTTGLAVRLSAFIERAAGDDGSLIQHQDALGKQITDIDAQVAEMERLVLANQQRLTDSFVAMETAQARINQQKQYLTQFLTSA